MASDPIASLKIWPVTLNLQAGRFRIGARPAADWLIVLYEGLGSVDGIRDLMVDADRDRLDEAILEEEATEDEVTSAFMDALTQVAGRPWWQVILMLMHLKNDWRGWHGRILLGGVDPRRMSLAAYLDAVYAAWIEGKDDSQIIKVNNLFETPPPGVKVELDQEQEEATFLSMMNASDRRPR